MFKTDFKYYKSRKNVPDFKDVLNFDNNGYTTKVKLLKCKNMKKTFFGLIPVTDWDVYEIINNPGLIFIRNPFTKLGQRYWITRSIQAYSKKPNKTNLDIHDVIPEDQDWWEYAQHNKDLLTKLRWATLGYHHNWDTKIYCENSKNIFPGDLSELCDYFGSVLNFDYFSAEAAIVNYYHMDSTLSGHTDHSEKNLEAPLFSFSFGQTAIFLIGGQTIDIKPTAMFLQSGDVVVMSKESRLCYHGVPRIVPCTGDKWTAIEKEDGWNNNCIDTATLNLCLDDVPWEPFQDYVKYSRININVRQVLQKGENKL